MLSAVSEFFQAVAKRFKKPPVLEGDLNFLELEHPEFRFTRIPPEDEHGMPCLKTYSPLGEIYVCAYPKTEFEIEPVVYVCTEFEYDGKKGKYCSQPCLEPQEGRYRGVVTTAEGEPVLEMTPFAAGAHSQIIAIKEFLSGEEYEKTVGENLLRAFEANLEQFILNAGLCLEDNRRESNAFLTGIWKRLKEFLGKEKLAKVGRYVEYSCETLGPVASTYTYHGFASGASKWQDFIELTGLAWKPRYDTQEYAEEYLRWHGEWKPEMLKEISVHDLLAAASPSEAGDLKDKIFSEIYWDLMEDIREELYSKSCRQLVKEGILWDEEPCERKEELERWIEEMEKHRPIPGMEEEYREALERYKDELEDIEKEIDETIITYAEREAEDKLSHYEYETYEELSELAMEGDQVARKMMDIIEEFCEEHQPICAGIAMEKRA